MKRRSFLAHAPLLPLLTGSKEVSSMNSSSSWLHTRVCDLLGIRYPIIQAGMASVAGPELVAAVSNAGGLGILAATMVPPDVLRSNIAQIRKLTDKPFGLNLILHQDFYPPADSQIDPATLRSVHGTLNKFRKKLGIASSDAMPPKLPPLIAEAYKIILEEAIPVFSIGLGNPGKQIVNECHKKGIKVMAMVSTVEDAMEVSQSGLDIIVAQGSEAGGHRSTWTKKPSNEYAAIGTLALVTQLSAKISQPIVAAGGITDGKGLAGAIAMGAEGVLVGTRFIASNESIAPDCHKQKILQSGSDGTTITDVFTGMYARVIRNDFTEEYRSSRTPVLPPGRQYVATVDIITAAAKQQNGDYYTLYAGQGIDNIRELRPAGDIVRDMVEEAQAIAGKKFSIKPG